jgi:hypothetical protein
MPYLNHVVGAAIFDLNGFPKQYFMTAESRNISWVQTIFQALGLRSLLMASLQLEGFHHAMVHGTDCNAIVVKQKNCYVAVLVQQSDDIASEQFILWVQNFQLSDLKQDPRFEVA